MSGVAATFGAGVERVQAVASRRGCESVFATSRRLSLFSSTSRLRLCSLSGASGDPREKGHRLKIAT